MDIDGGFPIYILDDDSVFFLKKDIGHVKFWEKVVSKILEKKYSISAKEIINLPYCQRRARIVGNILYCGEKLSKKIIRKIEKEVNIKLIYKYEEHETRCKFEISKLKNIIF